jgi:hypothetical protein
MRFWWALSVCVTVVGLLAALVGYDVFVIGPRGASVSETVKSYLSVSAVVASAAATAAGLVTLGPGVGSVFSALFLGTVAGGGVAVLLAVVTGNGPDEGDGFFWLTVASLAVSLLGASVSLIAARRLRPS